MATPLGGNTLTALSRRFILPRITDVFYLSNPLFFRLNQARRVVQGGTQLEVPLLYQGSAGGGFYSGYERLTLTPSDPIKNLAFDWRQAHQPVVVNTLDLIRSNTPDAIANLLDTLHNAAIMDLADTLGTALYSGNVAATNEIDGLRTAIDDGTVAATYGGLARAANTFLNAQVDSTTAALTLGSLQSMHGRTKKGGRTCSLITSRQEQYNRYWSLLIANQRFNAPAASDPMMANAGFDNLLLNGTPWVVDDKVFDGPNVNNSAIVFHNEDYYTFAVSPLADFYVEQFRKPIDQDAFVSNIFWAGNLMVANPQRCGKMTNVSG